MCLHPRPGVLVVLAAQSHEQMGDGLPEELVFLLAAGLELRQLPDAGLVELVGLGPEPKGLGVVERTHVGLGDRRHRLQDALLAAAGASTVPRDERVVVPAHHQHVAQGGGLGVLRPGVVVEPEVLLRRVRQQIQERGAAFVLGVHLLGLLNHPQRLVVAAGGDARGAALAQIRNEDREDPAASRALLLRRRENRVDLLIGHGHLGDDGEELALGLGRETVQLARDLLDDVRQEQGRLRLHPFPHEVAGALFDLGQQAQHLLPLRGVAHVVGDRRPQERLEVLRAVGERRVRADRDALHALRAVLRDEEGRLAPGHVLRGGVAAARSHHAQGGQRRRGRVVSVPSPELRVESGDGGKRGALVLPFGKGM